MTRDGLLFVLSGIFFLAGVLNPPILPTWGGSTAEVMATASAHKAAWSTTTWLITLSIDHQLLDDADAAVDTLDAAGGDTWVMQRSEIEGRLKRARRLADRHPRVPRRFSTRSSARSTPCYRTTSRHPDPRRNLCG